MAQFIVCDHPMAGSTRGRAASRSSDAADLPPTLVVFSKCGMGKDLDLGMIWGPKPRNFFQCNPCSPARGQEPICLQHLRFPNSSWCSSLVAWSSIPRVMQYYLFLETFGFKKNVQNLNSTKSQNPRATILKLMQNSQLFRFPSFVAIQYNECR